MHGGAPRTQHRLSIAAHAAVESDSDQNFRIDAFDRPYLCGSVVPSPRGKNPIAYDSRPNGIAADQVLDSVEVESRWARITTLGRTDNVSDRGSPGTRAAERSDHHEHCKNDRASSHTARILPDLAPTRRGADRQLGRALGRAWLTIAKHRAEQFEGSCLVLQSRRLVACGEGLPGWQECDADREWVTRTDEVDVDVDGIKRNVLE